MNFLCPSCRTPLPRDAAAGLVTCTQCSVQVDLTRVDTAPGQARLWPEVDLEGETISGYLLGHRLGSGGMGTVYEAESPVGEAVAMKVLSPLLAAEPALRERFRREARALSRVKHPRVVQLFEEGEDRGYCWYSMELVKGRDLKQRLDHGAMSVAEVDQLATALLEALAVIHEAGVVHRDLKPSNVLLGSEGPRLCDFGIAQVSGATTLTESAALLGSLRYMAPEQRWGKADERSDLYSLGVLLHEALAGGVPGEQSLPAAVPRSLARLIERLTQQAPNARPGSAAEAARLLSRLRSGALKRWAIGGGAATVGVLGLVGTLLFGGSSDPTATAQDSAKPPSESPVAIDAGTEEPLDAGLPLDAGVTPAPVATGLLAVRTKNVRAIEIDGQRLGVPKAPIVFPVGPHSIRFQCWGVGKVALRDSELITFEVTEAGPNEVSWNCDTMTPLPPEVVSTKRVAKPLPTAPPPKPALRTKKKR